MMSKETAPPRILLTRRNRQLLSKALSYVLLLIGAIIFVLPFIWMIVTSLKPPEQVFLFPIRWIPDPPVFYNYVEAWLSGDFLLFYWNTTYITVLSVIGTLISCSLAAYAFARMEFPGRDLIFYLILGTMMLPGQVTIIPLFIIYRELGWLNTHLPLWVPFFFGPPFFVFLIRQYFLTIPWELEDAAKIDGCNYHGILFHVFIPLAKPVLITTAIFVFMNQWNEFFMPLIILTSRRLFTVTLGLMLFQGEFTIEWNLLMAASVTAVMPCILVFFLFQRYFVEGLALTGLKG